MFINLLKIWLIIPPHHPNTGIDCEVIRGSINSDDTGSYYHGNLVAHQGTIDINQPYYIQFEYRYISGLTDWGQMFAFGTHYTYGGDNINFGLSINSIVSSSDHNWHRYTLTRNPDDTGLYLEIESLRF